MGDATTSTNGESPDDSAPTGALSGVRVLEIGSLIAGPFAGRLLADMGAEVVKIESPAELDPLREWGQGHIDGRGLLWPVQSRNKKLVTLDLRKGKEIFLRLVSRSDVVLENFKPGTLERWGLGYDELRAVNPAIVLVRVSGYGQSGPDASRAGFAAVAEAVSGLRSLNGYPGEAPPRYGVSLGDSLAGLFATVGALAALHQRDHSDAHEGQVVDVSLIESCMALLESVIPEFDLLGLVRQPSGTGLDGVAPSNIFRTNDNKWVVIAASKDNLFIELCRVMGRPELAVDPRFRDHVARGVNQPGVERIVAEWAGTKSAADIDHVLRHAGIPSGPVNSVADVVADEHLRERGAFVVHRDKELGEFVGPGVVPRLSRTQGGVRWSGEWTPGAHNDEIFGELLGLTRNELEELSAMGIL